MEERKASDHQPDVEWRQDDAERSYLQAVDRLNRTLASTLSKLLK